MDEVKTHRANWRDVNMLDSFLRLQLGIDLGRGGSYTNPHSQSSTSDTQFADRRILTSSSCGIRYRRLLGSIDAGATGFPAEGTARASSLGVSRRGRTGSTVEPRRSTGFRLRLVETRAFRAAFVVSHSCKELDVEVIEGGDRRRGESWAESPVAKDQSLKKGQGGPGLFEASGETWVSSLGKGLVH